MKVPISWLREYVAIDLSPQDLADKLTFSGVEVEGIETVGGDLEGLVVGEVVSVDPHPDADRLRLCTVDTGKERIPVVCGADNAEPGVKAPLALPGCTLAGGMCVKVSEIRGQRSAGMLCAEDELGLSDDHSGIMLLPDETSAGTPLADVLGPPDVVVELEITWNRPDCLSMIGIAREVAVLTGKDLKVPGVDFREAEQAVDDFVSVEILDPHGCPRYTARVLNRVRVAPSPLWLQRRLTLAGVRPISNIVDVTNYVMLECGQPLHAFDRRLLHDGQILVRRAEQDETLQTLDDVKRVLSPEDLVIADSAGPVALAGIMGGAGSEIGQSTESVLLESACFDPAGIHRTSARLGLSSESSYRFERCVDVAGADWASRRATALMVELGGGESVRGVVDVFPGKPDERTIGFRYEKACERIGLDIPSERMTAAFESLGLAVTDREPSGCRVRIPSRRPDLEIEADLIEEVARLEGLDKIPTAIPRAIVVPDATNEPARATSACRDVLVGLGLTETMNYSFVSEHLLNRVDRTDVERRVILPNPVSRDHAVMRPSLVPQMVESLGRNLSRQVSDVACFEMGRVFFRDSKNDLGEEDRLCIGLMGKVERGALDTQRPVEEEEVFLWLRGILEGLADGLRIPALKFVPASSAPFDEGRCFRVMAGDTPLGTMGLLAEKVRSEWRMVEPVAVAELVREPVLANVFRVPSAEPVPAYPSVTRDLAIVVTEQVLHGDVVRVVRDAAPAELTDVILFDIFRSKGLGGGKKSMAYSLTFRSSDKTLTDEEVNGYQASIRDALKNELNAELRES